MPPVAITTVWEVVYVAKFPSWSLTPQVRLDLIATEADDNGRQRNRHLYLDGDDPLAVRARVGLKLTVSE